MREYESLLRDYVKIYDIYKNMENSKAKDSLKEFLDYYFSDIICEYSMNNKMSMEEIIGYQLITGFWDCRKTEFVELLREYMDLID